ncbi:MAG TPA: hypothetical protein VFZ08_12505, partial [Terriglobia bacterium]|nr:hypothetical protein [Terriglobia bacterium]
MRASEIKPGQIWRSNETGEEWLVTKTYRELFDSYIVLRKIGGSESDVRRLKAEKGEVILPGFTLVEG